MDKKIKAESLLLNNGKKYVLIVQAVYCTLAFVYLLFYLIFIFFVNNPSLYFATVSYQKTYILFAKVRMVIVCMLPFPVLLLEAIFHNLFPNLLP